MAGVRSWTNSEGSALGCIHSINQMSFCPSQKNEPKYLSVIISVCTYQREPSKQYYVQLDEISPFVHSNF